MKRLACVAGILFFAGTPALAAGCVSPLTGKDAGGTTQSFGVTLDASTNCYGNIAIVDGANAANKATVTAGNALKVDGSAVTQPVSGTVTSNQGGAPWSVSQSGNWTARVVGNAGGIFDFAGQNAAQPANSILIGGEFNTTPTTLTTGNASPLQLDSAGNLLVNIKANSFGTLTVTGTITANQGTSPWVENVSQFGGSAVVTGTGASGAGIPRVTVSSDSNVLATQSGTWTVNQGGTWTVQQGTPPWTIQGDSASGAVNAGNPVKAGGVFNTTQPTVTTGQTVDAQSTARGALIVATGVDTFSATVSGTVTANQGGAPWSENITQFGGTNVSTGTGASGAGIPRITVANDSNILATQSGTWTVQQGTPPWSVSQSGNWTTRIVGNAGGILDAVGQNASPPANELLVAGQFNTTPTAITSGNISPLQLDTNGNLLVNVKVGGGTGGTSSSFGAAFPGTGTAIGVKNGANMVGLAADGSSNLLVNCAVGCGASGFADLGAFSLGVSNVNVMAGIYEASPAPVASGQGAAAMITANRALLINRRDSAGQELGGNLPGANNVPVRVQNAPALAYQPNIFQLTDVMGQPRSAAMITDGTKYASLTPPNVSASAAQTGLVVSLSPNGASVAATQSGTWTVQQGGAPWSVSGTITANQGGAPWSENVTQFGSTNISTGTGASGAGIPRVTVSNDSNVLATQSGAWTVAATQSGTWTVQPGNTANTTPWLVSINQGGNTAAVNASSQLSVNCANCSGSGVSQQDLTGFTFGTTNMVPIGGVYSTAVSSIPSGQAAAARLTANRALHDNPRDSSGQELGASLPGANNVALQVNQANRLTQYNQTIYPAASDASGSLRTASVIYDGQHYADVVAANQVPGPQNGALVVVPSPKLSLQCPFTVGISQTASTQIVTGQAGKFLHICGFGFVSASAQNVSLVEGTGSTCGTGTGALVGGTTASIAAAANGGLWNMTDRITIPMQKGGDNLCVLQSAAGNVSGTLTYGIF